MKISKVIITQKEYQDIKKYLDIDPCDYLDCGGMKCENCPFEKIVEELENVRCKFRRMLIEEVDVEGQK